MRASGTLGVDNRAPADGGGSSLPCTIEDFSSEVPAFASAFILVDGKQLAAVCRIKALRRLRCCALPVCGFWEQGDRTARGTVAHITLVLIRLGAHPP